jgi:hypothetical protein
MAPNSPISAPPWTVLGHRRDGRPIYLVAGGAEGDPVAEPEPDDNPEPDPAADPADAWTPPSREEYDNLVAAKRKADAEAAARRKYLRQHGIDPKTGLKVQPDPEPEPDDPPEPDPAKDAPRGATKAEVERAVRKAAAEAELRGLRKTKSLVVGFNEALSEAGWNGSRLGALMKLVDLDEVEIDDDGEIVGLAEQIAQVKTDFPELFKRTRVSANPSNGAGGSGQNGVTPAKVDTADKKPPLPEPKDWAEALARQAVRGG